MNKILKQSPKTQLPDLTNIKDINLTALEISLLKHVHHQKYKRIIVEKEFKSGYSDTRVFLVLPVKAGGESDTHIITKLGLKSDLQTEKQNYDELVKGSLPFSAAQVWDYYEQENHAALNYVFAGGGSLGQTFSLEEYYRNHTAAELQVTFDGLFGKELGPKWYAQNYPLNCLFDEEYGRHLPKHEELERVVNAIFHNMSSSAVSASIDIPGLAATPNPLNIYRDILNATLKGRSSLVHGDLHPRNVLVDEAGKGWLIDFAKVTTRHNIFDFIKLETYIRMMILAPLQADFSWNDYVRFELALNAEMLGQDAPLPINLHLAKAHASIAAIRSIARKYMGPEADFKKEYFPALFLYCLAMLKYYASHGVASTQAVFITACALAVSLKGKEETLPVSATGQNLSTSLYKDKKKGGSPMPSENKQNSSRPKSQEEQNEAGSNNYNFGDNTKIGAGHFGNNGMMIIHQNADERFEKNDEDVLDEIRDLLKELRDSINRNAEGDLSPTDIKNADQKITVVETQIEKPEKKRSPDLILDTLKELNRILANTYAASTVLKKVFDIVQTLLPK